MAEPIDDGRPFEVGDLWRPSSLIGESGKTDSLFDIELEDKPQVSLDLTTSDDTAHFVFNSEDLGLPGLTPLAFPTLKSVDVQLTQPVNVEADATQESADEDQSLWDGNFSLVDAPKLCSWEPLDIGTRSGPQSVSLLSEAGPLAFDAAVYAFDKSRRQDGVLPSDATLRALCNLCLGRPSVLFEWDEFKERFVPVLDNVSVSGLSQLCSGSMMTDIIDFGSLIVKLRHFTEARFEQSMCPAILAFRSGVASILSTASETVSMKTSCVKSWLQVHDLLARPRRLLQAVWSLVVTTEGLSTDVAVISVVADYVYTSTQVDDSFTLVWRTLLARVSRPWLDMLAADLGLDDTGAAIPSSDDTSEPHDECPEPRSPSDKRKSAQRQPSFVRAEDDELIGHTKKTLKLLQDNVPDHPLTTRAEWGIKCPTECFYEPFLNQSTISKRTRAYELRVINAMARNTPTKPFGLDWAPPLHLEHDIYSRMCVNEGAQEVYVSELVAQMSSYPDENPLSKFDELHDATSATLQYTHDLISHNDPSWTFGRPFNVLDQAIPLVKAQYRLANGALVRHLFRNCNLRQHLELQRSFHLLQNGDFVDRLSTALFSAETQSAERRRGRLPTGQKVGLRLGANVEQRWPPASSELQLTLMGILNEASESGSPGLSPSTCKGQLLGNLSFAVRELPEDEIERVLDPTSTHALDFLRLQYAALAPLDAVLTSEALHKYDGVFRFLLVMLRMVHVTTDCRVQVSLARSGRTIRGQQVGIHSTSMAMFVMEAHHFVSVMMSFVMDVGVNVSWRQFTQSLDDLEHGLRREDDASEIMTRTTIGVDGLRGLHDQCLERIRGCLFLRRRQEKVQGSVNDVMSAILKCAARLSTTDSEGFEAEYTVFRGAMTAFYASLQEKIDQPLSSYRVGSDINAESDACRMLLLRLRWKDYL